jgi:predicted  nucleic acid-binding Zn-ribbon protein
MTISPLLVFGALAISLAVLSFITLFLATRHDKVVSLAGPIEEEKAVTARIAEKRSTIDDLEDELRKRREALAHLADVQAEVDSLVGKLSELQTEWNQSDERRAEVSALRHEIEAARIDKLAVDAELAEARAALTEVSARMAKAEDLVHRIETLSAEAETLGARVEALREERRNLEEASDRVAALAKEAERLEQELGAIQGRISAKLSELTEMEDRLTAARNAQIDARQDLDRLNAELAAARQRNSDTQIEQAKFGEHLAMLEARKASLEREIERSKGIAAGGSGEAKEDPLQDLKVAPQVAQRLVEWRASPNVSETEALKKVRQRFDAFGLQYPDRTLRAFHTAMKVNDTTQMTVLAGISGTGKSQLPRQYAAGMGIGFLQVPVQPRWDSPQDLMGFYNYIEGRFRPTDLAKAMFALDEQNNPDAIKDRLLMVLLDEMNLARVEYYFSDFLSRLESRPARGREADKTLRKDAEIELEIPNAQLRIFPGYNLLFAGTMNEDESTQSLSDKVVDRANVMRFGAPKSIAKTAASGADQTPEALSRNTWERWCNRGLQGADQSRAEAQVNEMLTLMQDFGKPFGHRLGRAILAYAGAYPEADGVGDRLSVALADQIEMRLLPKLRGVEVEDRSQQFDQLRRKASEFGDEKLAEAIGQSVEAASASTGQFVWKGVVR